MGTFDWIGCEKAPPDQPPTPQPVVDPNRVPIACESYPRGPCGLPMYCWKCHTLVTQENVVHEECASPCETCDYCGTRKCPSCGEHICCGGCV